MPSTISAGTTAGSAISITGDTTGNLAFQTNGTTTAMTIDTSQNVGVGTTAPAAKLHIYNAATAAANNEVLRLSYTTSTTAGHSGDLNFTSSTGTVLNRISSVIQDGSNVGLAFSNYGSGSLGERVRITGGGDVGIGTNSPGSYDAKLAVFNGNFALTSTTNKLYLYYNSSTNNAHLSSATDGSITFITGTSSPTERARITPAGDILIGRNSDLGAGARVNIESASGEADILAMRYNNAGAGQYWRHLIDSANGYLLVNDDGTGVTIADGGTSWSAYSDERLKTDLKPIENAVNKVTTLRAVTGRYKTDEESKSRSFLIAQDVQNVLPEAVSTFKQVKSDDQTEYLSLAYTEVIPLLVAAIKEQQIQIEELKAEIQALKGAQ